MVTPRNKIAPLLVSMLLVTTALVPTMAGASEELRVVSDAEGDAVEEGGGAADLLELRAQTNATRLNFTIQVVDASDNPRLIQYRVDFTHDQSGNSYTAKVSYQTDGDLVSAFVGQEPIAASWSDNNLTLSIEREDVGSPAEGDDLIGVIAESRHGDNGDTFDDTDAGDYRIGNSAPDLASVSDKVVDEGQELKFNVTATDDDAVTLTAEDVPAGASFTDGGDADGDGTYNGTFEWTPDLSQAGDYDVTFVADDGDVTSSQTVQITVNDVTGFPEIEPIPDQTVDEGATLSFTVTATDPNGDAITLDNETALPGSATFTDEGDPDGDGTYNGTLDWTPDFDKAGTYTVTFVAEDSSGLSSTEDVNITVEDVNSAPSIDPVENQTVEEGNVTSFSLTATDAEGDTVTWNVSDLPEGAVFNDTGDADGDGTYNATFEWNTTTSDAGDYEPTFVADDGTNTNDVTVGISVTEKAAPELDPIDDQFVDEGTSVSLTLTANDPDGDTPLVFDNTTALPDGASLAEEGVFSWDTEQGDAGTYEIGVSVSDGSLSDTGTLTIYVLETNGAPTIDAPSTVDLFEAQTASFEVTATDPDGDELVLTASGLPTNATFVDNGDGTASFEWTPTFDEAGSYAVSFTADDDDLQDTVTTTISVADDAPVLEIEMRHSTISATEDPKVSASVSMANSGEGLGNVQIDVTAYWSDSASEELRFEQEASGRTTSTGESLITLDRDVQDLVNAPGEHIVEASVTWEDPATGETFDLSDSTSYTVS